MENIITPTSEIPVVIVNSKKKYLIISLISVALVLIIIGIYYFIKQSSVTTPDVSLIPASIPKPTENWTTYTNNENNYSINYPTSRTISETSTGIKILSPKLETENYGVNGGPQNIEIQVEPKLYSNSSGSYSINLLRQNKINDPESASKVTQEKINNLTFTVALINADPPYFSYLIENGNNYFAINFSDSNLTDEDKQILSNFKFSEIKVEVSTKKYTNTEFGYSLDYPSVWKDESDSNNNREFRFVTDKSEFVSGTVFDVPADNSNDKSWSKQFNLKNGKSLLITYSDNLGPGSQGGTKDIEAFNQFLSTLKIDQ